MNLECLDLLETSRSQAFAVMDLYICISPKHISIGTERLWNKRQQLYLVVFSIDVQLLASNSCDVIVRLWNPATVPSKDP